MKLLTEKSRQKMIDWLVKANIDAIKQNDTFLQKDWLELLFESGFEGYKNYTDLNLIQEYNYLKEGK